MFSFYMFSWLMSNSCECSMVSRDTDSFSSQIQMRQKLWKTLRQSKPQSGKHSCFRPVHRGPGSMNQSWQRITQYRIREVGVDSNVLELIYIWSQGTVKLHSVLQFFQNSLHTLQIALSSLILIVCSEYRYWEVQLIELLGQTMFAPSK